MTRVWLTGVCVLWVWGGVAGAAPSDDDRIQERYLSAALQNPRRGTAVEKLYQLAAQNEGVDVLVERLADQDDDAGAAARWTVIGLLQEMRGRDPEAIKAFSRAVELDADAYYANYCKGSLLLHRAQYAPAIECLTEALDATPEQDDAIEIRKCLGKCYLRSRKMNLAKQTWLALAKTAPDDPITLSELTALLVDEEQWDEALQYYERLAQLQKDQPYQVVLCTVGMGNVEARRGRFDEALKRYEQALSRTAPGSWLAGDIRLRIEELFRKRNDLSGLVDYYTGRLDEADDGDVQVMVVLARLLVELDRADEARTFYDKALALAPNDESVRLAYIQLLELADEHEAAVAQYEHLLEASPKHVGYLEAIGKLHLACGDELPFRSKARQAWQTIAETNPSDPATMVQVAELFRGGNMNDDAGKYFLRAIELAPEVGQYREYYGEFLVGLDRRDEALEVFKEIAAGSRRSVDTLMRLADVLSYFGYKDEALAASRGATALQPDHFEARMQLVKLLADAGAYDDALAELDAAAEMAPNDFSAGQAMDQRVRLLSKAGKLAETLEQQLGALADRPSDQVSPYIACAKMALALGRLEPAADMAQAALARAPNSVPVLELAARIYARTGDRQRVVATLTTLIELAPQNRMEYYRRLSSHHAAAGETEAAIAAAEAVIEASPDNPDGYQLVASLCDRFGLADRSLDVLKNALKIDPKNVDLRLQYGSRLLRSGEDEAAIEQYWQAYEAQEDVDGKLSVVRRLADACYQADRFGQLIDRLERRRRLTQDDWVPTLCLAEAYKQIEDYGKAREMLAPLVAKRPKDTDLLGQLVRLTKAEGQTDEAVRYLRELVKLEPKRRSLMDLAELLLELGHKDEAIAFWHQAALTGDDKSHTAAEVAADLIDHQLYDQAVDVLEPVCQRDPDDWSAAYWRGVALLKADRSDEAREVFDHVAALPDLPEATTGQRGKSGQPASVSSWGHMPAEIARIQRMQSLAYQLSGRYQSRRQSFRPPDLDTARIAAWYQCCQIAMADGRLDAMIEELKAQNTADAWRKVVCTYVLTEKRDERLWQAVTTLCELDPGDLSAKWMRFATLVQRRAGEATEVTLDEARLMRDDLSQASPGLGAYLNSGWLHYLRQRGHDEELADYARQLAAGEFTEMQEARWVVMALGQAEQLDLAVEAMDRADAQFPDAGASMAAGWQWMYTRLTQLAIQKERPELADEFFKRSLRETRPKSKRIASTSVSYYGFGQRATDFPGPNPYYDQSRLHMLQQIYQAAGGSMPGALTSMPTVPGLPPSDDSKQKDSEPSDAMTAMRNVFVEQLSSPDQDHRLEAHLGLAYFDWWSGKRDDAAARVATVVEMRPWDVCLRVSLAQIRLAADDYKGTLDVLSSIRRRYHPMYKIAQQLTLRAAEHIEDRETAKAAALRLFSMRLTSSERLELAATMHGLGLSDKATQLERQVQQVSSGDLSQLVDLMRRQKGRGDIEQAAGVARQVLRHLGKAQMMGNERHYRQEALRLLNEAGLLDEMIANAEQQRKDNPEAVRVLVDLWHYYSVKRNQEKAAEVAEQALKLRPDDADMRYQYALALYSQNQQDEAAEQIALVLQSDPDKVLRDIWQTIDIYRNAQRLDDLAAALEPLDFEKLFAQAGNYSHQLAWNLIQVADAATEKFSSLPEWMADFEDTGQSIDLADRRQPTARLYKKHYSAGRVVLGAAGVSDETGRRNNYFVLVVPTEQRPAPSNPSPGDGAVSVGTSTALCWSAVSGATGYRVHFGTEDPPPQIAEHAACYYPVAPLSAATTYYWRVDAATESSIVEGPTWQFTTAPAAANTLPVLDTTAIERGTAVSLAFDTDMVLPGVKCLQIDKGRTEPTRIGGRPCHVNASSDGVTFFHFALSDDYIAAHGIGRQYITVDYFDAPGGQFQMHYDSDRERFAPTKTLRFGGTGLWRRHTYVVDDAKFVRPHPEAGDFRLAIPAGKMVHIAAVRVSVESPTQHDETIDRGTGVAVILGEENLSKGLTHTQYTTGPTKPTKAGGRPCRENEDLGRTVFFYFNVDPAYAKKCVDQTQYLTIEYYDDNAPHFQLHYDSTSERFAPGKQVRLGNTGTWKTYTYTLADAGFTGDGYLGGDFRIAVPAGGTLRVASVRLSTEPPPTHVVATLSANKSIGYAPLEVTFDASKSTGADEDLQFAWQVGGQTAADSPTTTWVFDKPGTYRTAVTVTDKLGHSDAAGATVTVLPATPKLSDLTKYEVARFLTGQPYRAGTAYTIKAMPVRFEGCLGIKTRNDTGSDSTEELAFDVDRESDVYLACDVGGAEPANVLPFIEKLLASVIDDPQHRSQAPRVVRDRTRVLFALHRADEALEYLLASSEMFKDLVDAAAAQRLEASGVKIRPAAMLNSPTSYNHPEGDPQGLTSDLLNTAERHGRLESLRDHLQQKLAEDPQDLHTVTWAAMVDARLGRYEQARLRVGELLEALDDQKSPATDSREGWATLLWLDRELSRHDELAPQSLACCQRLAPQYAKSRSSGLEGLFYVRLANRYAKAGQTDTARQTLLALAQWTPTGMHDPRYAAMRRLENMKHAAQALEKMGHYQDAYNVATDLTKMKPDPSYGGQWHVDEAKRMISKLLKEHPELKPATTQPASDDQAEAKPKPTTAPGTRG